MGWRLDRAAKGAGGSPSAQHVGVVDAVATRVIILSPVFGPARGIAQVKALLDEFTQTQVLGEGHRKDQPSISHQAVVVEGDLDSVGMVKWQHLLGAPCFGSVLCFQNHYPRTTGALSYPFSTPQHSSFSVDRGLVSLSHTSSATGTTGAAGSPCDIVGALYT